jgi:hypothetical protein
MLPFDMKGLGEGGTYDMRQGPPPDMAYKVQVVAFKPNVSKTGKSGYIIDVVVVDGPAKGMGGRTTLTLPDATTNPNFTKKKYRDWFLACLVPSSAIEAGFCDETHLIGKHCVCWVEEHEDTVDGREKTYTDYFPISDIPTAQAALAGTWTRRGGMVRAQAAPPQQQQQPQQPPQAPPQQQQPFQAPPQAPPQQQQPFQAPPQPNNNMGGDFSTMFATSGPAPF